VKDSTISLEEAERQTLEFIELWTLPNTSPLCGNSIAQDRRFLRRYMPAIDKHLHYRIIDISSLKELAWRWFGMDSPEKQETHRALDDIRESIEELRFYRSTLFKSHPGADS
jgi:oligoribonuclease